MNTVDIPNTDPITGPATQLALMGGADVEDAVDFGVDSAVAVDFANAADSNAC
jgi:hypothetical protein